MNKELNKKLAEWAGFIKASSGWVEGVWKFPFDGTNMGSMVDQSYQVLPDFTSSLDACFKWLVPKLDSLGWYLTLRSHVYSRDLVRNPDYEAALATGSERIRITAHDFNSALALCLAIEKLIDGGSKHETR